MLHRSIISTKDGRPWQGIPTIERAPNGRLWCAFYTGGPKEPDPDNVLLLTTSADDGRTWSVLETIVAPSGATRAYDPCLWHDPQGRLWLIYNQANLETRTFGLWAMVADASDRADPCWGAPFQIELPAPFCFRLNKPTVLSSGEWLLPVTWAKRVPEGWFARGEQLQGVAISCDGGASWALQGEVVAPAWALENMIVERRDGSLWMLIRTGAGVLWESISHDRGRTWGPGAPTAIVNPGSRFFIRRLASGGLLLINTSNPRERRGLHACLNDGSDGVAFERCLQLDDRDRVSYPDAVQAPDGRIYCVHDCDRQGLGEILLSVFREEDLVAS
jgi:predicted neuraminidase